MSSSDDEGPPTVLVASHTDAPPAVVREVLAGVEEQGVPTAGVGGGDDPDAGARHAARESRLEVGVGVGPDGAVVVRHALVADPVLVLPPGARAADRRQAGGDAARIVAGLPLRCGAAR
ncbi:glycerol dehydratase reactivase beta/small subunit family protein [Actinomycetospora termitidis]|uniref:Glycerol dehydratase reactivase beta/small subunit family protein n=1 Tax=Actinomycetospora termitidis TaxID=3053470 RepID=A0ABT7MD43_9PSEU|nr:glycerol dehydratase reactivase beta/small subunit family protein [Actinomycetospora sp. Odt1-22]MDL5157772.1 glycerol dehydratase reactivase beta/small subunit family protein [Actinomycetospora sp. Odt1-22]